MAGGGRRRAYILIKQWRDQLLEGATGVFGEAPKAEAEPVIDVKTLHAKIVTRLPPDPDRRRPEPS